MTGKKKISQPNSGKRSYKNPYLNFLEDFREEVKGRKLKPTQLLIEGGKRWRKMNTIQREPYKLLALNAPASRKPRKVKRLRRGASTCSHSYVSDDLRSSVTSLGSSEV